MISDHNRIRGLKTEAPPQSHPVADPNFTAIQGTDFTRTLYPRPAPAPASKPPTGRTIARR